MAAGSTAAAAPVPSPAAAMVPVVGSRLPGLLLPGLLLLLLVIWRCLEASPGPAHASAGAVGPLPAPADAVPLRLPAGCCCSACPYSRPCSSPPLPSSLVSFRDRELGKLRATSSILPPILQFVSCCAAALRAALVCAAAPPAMPLRGAPGCAATPPAMPRSCACSALSTRQCSHAPTDPPACGTLMPPPTPPTPPPPHPHPPEPPTHLPACSGARPRQRHQQHL